MPKNAYLHPDDLPLDLQLDLLVDGELSDIRRRELLTLIDRQPAQWRDVALRFLSQQTEKQSVKALMKGGNLVPVELNPPVINHPVIGRVGWYRISGVAAALAIAAASALVTLWITRAPAPPTTSGGLASIEHTTSLSGEFVDAPTDVVLKVPVVPVSAGNPMVPIGTNANNRGTKTIYVMESDGKGGLIIIPVSASKTPVY